MTAAAAEYEVPWKGENNDEQPHFHDILPEVPDKNAVPNVVEGSPSLGTPDDPWHGVTVKSESFTLLIHANKGADRVIMGFEVIPNWATMTARINMIQLDEESELAVLSLRQMSPEAPLTVLAGTEANDQDATISKVNGTGAVDGPKKKFGMDTYGWKFANKMEKVNLNGTIYYRPLYLPDVVEE